MAEHRITCVDTDEEGVTTHIGGPTFGKMSLSNAITYIESGAHRFYTLVNGKKAWVYVKSREGRKYLTTSPDGTERNNLDDLPNC